MLRRTAYLDESTAEAVEALRPGFLSQSSWLALLISVGLERQRELMGAGKAPQPE